MKKRSIQYLLSVADEIKCVSALDSDSLGYYPKPFAGISLPSREIQGNEFVRKNGKHTLNLLSPSQIGLPYGGYPRILIVHITSVAKISATREIYLCNSLNQLLKQLGIRSTGGSKGTLTSFKKQFQRLLACSIKWIEVEGDQWTIDNINIANNAKLLWDPYCENKWETYLTLDYDFFINIKNHAIPIDTRVTRALCHFPLAFDLYCFLTGRYYRLANPTIIKWVDLRSQIGNQYARQFHYRQKIEEALKIVNLLYPAAKFEVSGKGLKLYPSKTHIPPIKKCIQ